MRASLVVYALLMAELLTACGSDNKGSSNASNNDGTGGNMSTINPKTCFGETFAKLDAPYVANSAGYESAVADAAGLVLAPLVDRSQLSDPYATQTGFPDLIVSIDTQGAIKQIWSGDTMPLTVAADASNVYFTTMALGGNDLMSVPRAGGSATVLLENTIWGGPVLIGGKLYFGGAVGDVSRGIFEFDPAGGTPKLLNDRGDTNFGAFTGNATWLYWTEFTSTSSPDSLYRLKLADNSVELLGSIPSGVGDGELFAVGNDLYMGGIVDISYQLNHFVAGQSPVVVVQECSGAIAFSDSAAYYGSRSGLVKTPLDFSVTTEVSGAPGTTLSAIVVGPDKLWYAEGPCIYRRSL